MAKQSPHKRWKGCAMCDYHKFKDHGQAIRQPFSVLRKVGKARRLTRHEVYGEAD